MMHKSVHVRQSELVRYLEGDPIVRSIVDPHLAGCESCQLRLNSLREFDLALRSFLTGADVREKIELIAEKIKVDKKLVKAATQIMKKEAASIPHTPIPDSTEP